MSSVCNAEPVEYHCSTDLQHAEDWHSSTLEYKRGKLTVLYCGRQHDIPMTDVINDSHAAVCRIHSVNLGAVKAAAGNGECTLIGLSEFTIRPLGYI